MTSVTTSVREVIEKISADPLGCFITVIDDAPAARSQDAALGGLVFAVKDNIDTKELPTTAGTGALRNSRPQANHPALDRLEQAGATLVGKTNMHELAFGITSNNGVFGPVHNPYDRARSAGGSSGGSAAAVASGLVPVALGTDTGGSTTIPAAWCGVTGFRPTTGRYGWGHVVPLSQTRDTVGLIADTVARLRQVDAVLAPSVDVQAQLSLEGLRLGLPSAGYLEHLDDDVDEVWRAAQVALSQAGVSFVEVDTRGIHELEASCGFDIVFYEVVRDLSDYLANLPVAVTLDELIAEIGSPDVAGLMAAATGTERTEEQYRHWLALRKQSSDTFDRAFRQSGVDALFYPTTPITATPLGDDLTTVIRGVEVPVFPTVTQNTLPGSDVGLPAVTLPGGLGSRGLPVGLTVEGPQNGDARLLAVAEVMAETLG